MSNLECIEVNTTEEPDSSVIWLHGLGADAYDFETLAKQLQLPTKLGIRFIFPHAPIRPISINSGYPMRAWFDISSLDEKAMQDAVGIGKSEELIRQLIAREIQKGIPSHRIIIGGFSQGGALALHLGLRYPKKLAGVIALSAFMPLADLVFRERQPANLSLPFFLGHGVQDSIVLHDYGLRSRDLLKNLGYPVTWRDYPIAHTVSPEEIKDVSEWLQKILNHRT